MPDCHQNNVDLRWHESSIEAESICKICGSRYVVWVIPQQKEESLKLPEGFLPEDIISKLSSEAFKQETER